MSKNSYTINKTNQVFISDESDSRGKCDNGLSSDTRVWMTSDDGGRGGERGESANGTSPKQLRLAESRDEEGSTLSIHDINYTLKVTGKQCCGDVVEKRILKNIEYVYIDTRI